MWKTEQQLTEEKHVFLDPDECTGCTFFMPVIIETVEIHVWALKELSATQRFVCHAPTYFLSIFENGEHFKWEEDDRFQALFCQWKKNLMHLTAAKNPTTVAFGKVTPLHWQFTRNQLQHFLTDFHAVLSN
jgi:hypothetical protein